MEVDEELGICCTDLIECLSEFICNFSEIGSECARALAERGGNLLNLIENASRRIGEMNVQFSGDIDILKNLQELFDDAEKTEDVGGGIKFMLKMFRSKIKLFERLVNTEWNQNCGKVDTADSPKVDTADSPEAPKTKPDEDSQIVYKKITPHKLNVEYKCKEEGCSKSTPSLAVYKRHMRDDHKKEPGQDNVVKVTCMLPKKKSKKGETCDSKLPLSEMYRHLDRVHNKPRLSKDTYLRFFKSFDGGQTYSEPVYLRASEDDPVGTTSASNVGTDIAKKASAKRKLSVDDVKAPADKVSKSRVETPHDENDNTAASRNTETKTADSEKDKPGTQEVRIETESEQEVVIEEDSLRDNNSAFKDVTDKQDFALTVEEATANSEMSTTESLELTSVTELNQDAVNDDASKDAVTQSEGPETSKLTSEESRIEIEAEPEKSKPTLEVEDAFCSDAEFDKHDLDSDVEDDDDEDFIQTRL